MTDHALPMLDPSATATSTSPIIYPDPIPGIIPFQTLTVFAGAPGVGKTAMLADWIARWRSGRTIWGQKTNAPVGGFYYLAGDRQWESHARWLEAAGIPSDSVPHYSLANDRKLDHKRLLQAYDALDLFTDCLNQLAPPPGAHVIVDPVSPLFIAGSANNGRDVARTLLGMSRIIQDRLINLTLVAHFGKQPSDSKAKYARPQDRIAGSGAFSGFSDTQIYLIDPEPPDNPYHVLGWNPRHQRPQDFACTRGENGLFVPYDAMQDDVTAQQILDQFEATGPTSVAVIVDRSFELHQLSRATVKRALDRLVKNGRIAKVGRGRFARIKVH